MNTAWQVANEPHRYELGRRWEEGNRLCLWVMMNPSTATDTVLDPTLRRCQNFSKAWGYQGFIIGNLFAFRSPHPRDLRTAADPVGPKNHHTLEVLVSRAVANRCDIVCGWGADPFAREEAARFVEMTKGAAVLKCLGRNKDGSPKHPLYPKKTSQLEVWP